MHAGKPERGGERPIWKGRKAAFGAIGQISDYYCMDGVIPLAKLPRGADRGRPRSAAATDSDVANIFHAGDGNLHPLILYNANDRAELERAELCGAEILKLCVELGGCLTGEHGVGIEKRELMRVQFTAADLAQQMRVKGAFDPDWLLNPGQGVSAGRARAPVTGNLRLGFHAPDYRARARRSRRRGRRHAHVPLEVRGRGSKLRGWPLSAVGRRW